MNVEGETDAIVTSCPTTMPCADGVVTVTTLLDLEIALMENDGSVRLFGIVSVAGRERIFAKTGLMENVVSLLMRMLLPLLEDWRTLNANVGPLVLDGVLWKVQLDCATFVPTVTGR